jgi:hypothetical protein
MTGRTVARLAWQAACLTARGTWTVVRWTVRLTLLFTVGLLAALLT